MDQSELKRKLADLQSALNRIDHAFDELNAPVEALIKSYPALFGRMGEIPYGERRKAYREIISMFLDENGDYHQ